MRATDDLRRLQGCLTDHGTTLRRLSEHYSLLASESRLKILALLECAGEICVCDLASVLVMTPAAVSQHLSRLRVGRLVASRREGMTIYYRRTEMPVVPPLVLPKLEVQG